MGHYASEMGDYTSPARIPDSEREAIKAFFGKEYTGINSPCPRCGASLEWEYTGAQNLLLHIKWHRNLAAILGHQSRPAPGLVM